MKIERLPFGIMQTIIRNEPFHMEMKEEYHRYILKQYIKQNDTLYPKGHEKGMKEESE